MVDLITFKTAENKLTVTFVDGQTLTFSKESVDEYKLKFPDRIADLVAMGWLQKDEA